MVEFLTFSSIYQPRIWGGERFEKKLGRTVSHNPPIGESWDLVDRPEARSVVSMGPHSGETLNDLLQENSAAIMGPKWNAATPFPVLVKWLDCSDRLSLQVHPPALIAETLKGEPKDENWYFVDCDSHATIIAGFQKNIDPQAFLDALKEDKLEEHVQTLHVKAEDSFYIPSSRIHAIGGGNLILEIQQNSDTTYRVYDWGRVGLDGKPRELHIEESLQSIDFQDINPRQMSTQGQSRLLADSPSFRIHKLMLKPGQIVTFPQNQQPSIVSVVQGVVKDLGSGVALNIGTTALLPYDKLFRLESSTHSTILVTDKFSEGCTTDQPFVI
jgi:mannose-6-phosphate isomerase